MNWTTTDLARINAFNKNTLMEHLNIQFVEISDEGLQATMPVNHTTHQPMGRLHGGASAALIESIGSMGSALLCDLSKESPVGLEVNANHIAGLHSGQILAKGRPVHIGKKTHLWQVDIYDETEKKLVCTGRITIMIIPNKLG